MMLQEVTVSELLKNISDIVEVNNDDSSIPIPCLLGFMPFVILAKIFKYIYLMMILWSLEECSFVCYCRLQMDYLTKFWWRAPTILVSG